MVDAIVRWQLDKKSFRAYDGTANDYGAPSGAGVAIELSADGTGFFKGTITASVIEGSQIQPEGGIPASGPFMEIDMVQQLLRVSDGTRDRVQVGSLAAYTDPNGVASPSEDGMRVLDSNGNLIFDTVGLMATLGIVAQPNGGPQTITSSTPVEITDSVATFTLTRRTNFIVFGACHAQTSIQGDYVYVQLQVDGVIQAQPYFGFTTLSEGSLNWAGTLDAGTHTIELTGSVVSGSGSVLTVWDFHYYVLQLGG